ncbi:SAM-dependent methyltransferase [Actinoplanes sp. NPDC051470]|uniref:SAM-dependent methyltransferase n=1 Tax=unclassified Actinoplanes TaxID=2626549 RepID=UPI0034420741
MSEDFMRRPSSARIYDALLGGSHNFAADREAAQKLLAALPYAAEMCRINRAFLGRAVQHMAGAGIRQFLDVGSGIPTVGNVHEVAQALSPEARVVYVDIDPVAVEHSREILAENPVATVIQADVRFADDLLARPELRSFLDFTQPIGLLMLSMLHFVPDDDAFAAVDTLRGALAPGSFLAISHGVSDTPADASAPKVASIYTRSDVPQAEGRPRSGIQRFFGDATLEPPGLVWLHEWPVPPADSERPEHMAVLAGVARV